MTTDQLERFHRRPKRDKAIDPPLRRRCSNPWCPTLWEAEPDGPFCLHCHQLVRDRADELRAPQAKERDVSMDPSERQKKIEAEVEQGYTQGEAAGRQAAREAGYEPPDAHGYDEPGTVGHDRPGPKRGD